jgi:hypothetical protein
MGVLICGLAALLLPSPGLRANATIAILVLAGIAWTTLDARWIRSQGIMGSQTLGSYPLLHAQALDFGGDTRVKDIVERYRGLIDKTFRPSQSGQQPLVLIGSEDPSYLFQRLRARYHLLPEAGLEVTTPAVGASTTADFAILIKSAFRDPAVADTVTAEWLEAPKGAHWQLLEEDSDGALLMRRREK